MPFEILSRVVHYTFYNIVIREEFILFGSKTTFTPRIAQQKMHLLNVRSVRHKLALCQKRRYEYHRLKLLPLLSKLWIFSLYG